MSEPEFKGATFPITVGLIEILGSLSVALVVMWAHTCKGGFYWKDNPLLELNWHSVLMTVAMIFLNANTIVAMQTTQKSYWSKVLFTGMHSVVLLMMTIAMLLAHSFQSLQEPPIPNLCSLHSWVGMVAMSLFICQWLGGLVVYVFPRLKKNIRVVYFPIHFNVGLVAFVCSVMSAILGLVETIWSIPEYAGRSHEGSLVNYAGILLLLLAALVVFMAKQPRSRIWLPVRPRRFLSAPSLS